MASAKLVVHAPRADRVDVAPVRLVLRMDLRVAVDLARRRQQVPGAGGLREAERVVGTERADLQCLDRVLEVVPRARRAREVQDGVDGAFDVDVLGDVVLPQVEGGNAEKIFDVRDPARQEAVDREHLPPPTEQRPTKMGTQEPGATGDDGARHQRPRPS
jgi:hypothetical protein